MSKYIYLLIISVIIIFVQGCYYDVEEELYPSTTCDTSGITYSQTVRPILDQNCMSCHNPVDKMGNIVLESYTDVMIVVNSGQLIGAINHDPSYSAMPQGAAKLDDCTILKIETWVHSGSPEN